MQRSCAHTFHHSLSMLLHHVEVDSADGFNVIKRTTFLHLSVCHSLHVSYHSQQSSISGGRLPSLKQSARRRHLYPSTSAASSDY